MTVNDTIEKPNISPVILLEITAGKWCRNLLATDLPNAFVCITDLPVTGVKFNGTVNGTPKTSLLDVNSTPGSWYFDGQRLYVSSPSGGSAIFSDTVVAVCSFFFSTKPKVFGSQYYEPRLVSAPNVSMQIEANFSGVGQVGGGTARLINNDGYFDTLSDLKWNNGKAVLKFGADTLNAKMAYSDYVTLATWLIEDWNKDNEKFELKLKEIKSRSNVSLPLNFFSVAVYPALPQESYGKPIPLAYGKIISAKPVLVDLAAKRFKIADHAILSLDDVRISSGGGWRQSSFATTNLSAGEFTLGADWTGVEDVAVDFSGKKNNDGSLMANASDIVKDLLALAGETGINSDSFSTAWARLDGGTDEDGRRITLLAPSLYISETRDLFDIISQINQEIGSFLYVDPNGNYFFGVFQPKTGEGLKQFNILDTFEPAENIVNGDASGVDTFSRVSSSYAKRAAENFTQFDLQEVTANQFSVGIGSAKTKDVELDFTSRTDARYYGQRFLITEARRQKTIQVRFPWRGWLLQPGDQIQLDYDRFGGKPVADGIGYMALESTFISR